MHITVAAAHVLPATLPRLIALRGGLAAELPETVNVQEAAVSLTLYLGTVMSSISGCISWTGSNGC